MGGYSDTIFSGKTDFPAKAKLPQREPAFVQEWDDARLYERIIEARKGAPRFVMHDGPPYANGNIHHGHILNKVLKDIVVKSRTMAGFFVDFIPGWDCHGLPIELMVEKKHGKREAGSSALEFRKKCAAYAEEWIDIQRGEFKRLGVLGRWNEPYKTLSNTYEAVTAREFGKFVAGGYVYRGKKPVYWCWSDQTALAEAEVEYDDHTSPSIYVRFPVDSELLELPKAKGKTSIIIWTTTPWTLPANLGLAFHPQLEYVAVAVGDETWILAKGLLGTFMKEVDVEDYEILDSVDPKSLEKKTAQHPFADRESLIVLADHVTLEQGTGIVHTAPGHGHEDYVVGQKYGLEPFTPVNDKGVFTEEAGEFAGQFVFKANKNVVAKLEEVGALIKSQDVEHQYAHCWRCKNPVIYRATEQWFISMDHEKLRERSLHEIDRVEWIPPWGRDRIHGMIEARPDWCISRQRVWGVPIIAFTCSDCGGTTTSGEIVDTVADRFETEGADAWYAHEPNELVPGVKCAHCESKNLVKDDDILDVWFESGVSYAAVCEVEETLGVPVDLYLEGSDQHRGWFHSTLLAAVGTREKAPYRAVLTHGFVVNEKGKPYSKSLKNFVPPENMLKSRGAEILRLWVAAEDYRADMRIGDEQLQSLSEAYRKIRNTARFMLANLYDFDPDSMRVAYGKLNELDRWALFKTGQLVERVKEAYEKYEFHKIYHLMVNFFSVDMSAVYLDVLKDRLYSSGQDWTGRRGAQTVIFHALSAVARLLAPVLCFTSDEIWKAMPKWSDKEFNIHLALFPETDRTWLDEKLGERWERLLDVRRQVTGALEKPRAEKAFADGSGKTEDAAIVLHTNKEELRGFLESFTGEWAGLADVFKVASVGVESGDEDLRVAWSPSDQKKCDRCWNRVADVGGNSAHPDLCGRCVKAIA